MVPEAKSASVASGYKVFMLRIARRDIITSFNAFLKALQNKTNSLGKFTIFHTKIVAIHAFIAFMLLY